MATEEDAVELKSVSIEPNDCPLGDRISIKLGFKTNRAVEKAVWDLKYMVDMASKRRVIPLATTEETSYAAGAEASMEISSEGIDVSGFKPHQLANAGLLMVTLSAAGEELVTVNLVTQVTKKEGDFSEAKLFRTVYSPLEE